MVGESVIRVDALSKATGTETYAGDMDFPGALHAVTLRSAVASGALRAVRFDPSFDWAKITAVTADNFPGHNFVTMIARDYPALAQRKINFRGEAVCLLAAETRQLAEEALRHVTIECDPLPAVFTIEDSVALKAVVKEPDNVLSEWNIRKGNIDEGMDASDLVVEGEYRTGPVEHAYLEPNGIVALPLDGGGVRILGSLQCPYYVHNALRKAFDLPDDRVIVAQAPTGGAFGGKEDFPSVLAVQAAALALRSGRPVKLFYGRSEDIIASSKRHPSLVRHRTGVAKDGTLTAMRIDFYLDGGAYSTMSPVVLQRGVLHATGPYRCPHVSITGKAMATNHAPRGAFRGFGTPQAIFAVERQMDLIASRLGMDPAEIRRKNAFVTGDSTATGQILRESTAPMLVLDRVVRLAGYKASRRARPPGGPSKGKKSAACRGKDGRTRRGVGLSLFWHGGAFTGSGEMRIKGRAAIRLSEDCEGIQILSSTVEMGQGYRTVISQIAARALEVDMSRISVAEPDTSVVPDTGPTVASRTTMVVGSLVKKACETLIGRVKDLLAVRLKCAPSAITYRAGVFYDGQGGKIDTFPSACKKYLESGGAATVEETFALPPGHHWDEQTMQGDAYPCFSWAADVIEVEVDMDTFQVTPLRATMVFDAGRVINPQTATGQFEGGTLQSIGWAGLEEMKYDGGRLLNDRLATYVIPTASDCPEYHTEILEIPYSHGPFGAKGIGELPYDGAAPALASAIEDATGIRVTRIPATPEDLLGEWMKKKEP